MAASDRRAQDPSPLPVHRSTPAQACATVALEIARLASAAGRDGGRVVLGLATGRTMVPLYAELVRLCRSGQLSFGRIVSFNLDEYCELDLAHPGSMHSFMDRHLFDHVDQPPEQRHFPQTDPACGPLERRCEAYERAIRAAGGLDLQLLGIGTNGHVAFNEPGSPFDSATRRVYLAPSTVEATVADFGSAQAVPRAAISMGLATIRAARRVRLLAFGAHKRAAVARLRSGPVGEDCPATALRGHPDFELWADDAALGP
jgi:glucosamine-6-phosphate deaminase